MRRSAEADRTPVTLEGRDATAWEAAADAHEREGEWREAVRSRYRVILAELLAAGRVVEVPGRTAREYLREAASGDDRLRGPLAEATALFEQAWYADDPVGSAEARRTADLATEVRGLLSGAAGDRSPVGAAR